MYEFLLSADLMVPDPDAHAALLVKRLGILERADYRQAFPTHGYIAHFLRVHKSLAVAPTRLEPQHHVDVAEPVDPIFAEYLDSIDEFQGRYRPVKTHSCVIACSDMEGLIEKLHRRKLPFRVAPIDERLAWERVWVGTTPEQPRYTPIVDGGSAWNGIRWLRCGCRRRRSPRRLPSRGIRTRRTWCGSCRAAFWCATSTMCCGGCR